MELIGVDNARSWIDGIALLLLATALCSVAVRRLDTSIRLLALQGLLLAAAAVTVAGATGTAHAYLAAMLTLVVKALVVPGLLFFALREVRIKKELEAAISRRLALPLAAGLVLAAYYVTGPFSNLDGLLARNALPVAIAMLFIGLLSMLTHKKALSQIIGIVAMENGVYLVAIAATQGLPLAVEMAVAVDLVVGVLVMSVFTRLIHRSFDTINTDNLRALRG